MASGLRQNCEAAAGLYLVFRISMKYGYNPINRGVVHNVITAYPGTSVYSWVCG